MKRIKFYIYHACCRYNVYSRQLSVSISKVAVTNVTGYYIPQVLAHGGLYIGGFIGGPIGASAGYGLGYLLGTIGNYYFTNYAYDYIFEGKD